MFLFSILLMYIFNRYLRWQNVIRVDKTLFKGMRNRLILYFFRVTLTCHSWWAFVDCRRNSGTAFDLQGRYCAPCLTRAPGHQQTPGELPLSSGAGMLCCYGPYLWKENVVGNSWTKMWLGQNNYWPKWLWRYCLLVYIVHNFTTGYLVNR